MAEDEPVQPESNRQAMRLKRSERLGAGVLAAVLFGVAGWAVIKGTDGTAVLAFVVVAGLFALLAVIGAVPQRIKSGEHVMELYDVIEQKNREIEAATDVMTPEQLREAAEAAEPAHPSSSSSGGSLRDIANFELKAIANLQRAVNELPGAKVDHPDGPPGAGGGNPYVSLPNGHRVLVEAKYSMGASGLRQLMNMAWHNLMHPQHVLVIGGPDFSPQAARRFREMNEGPDGHRLDPPRVLLTRNSKDDILEALYRFNR